jgi:cysteine desulfuration protein SufE
MPAGALEQFEEDFSLFDNWEDRYRYLIELGDRLKPMDDSLKTSETLVKGCTSQVWMIAEIKDGRFHFTADSDAHIVRGLVYLLLAAYQDKTAAEIRALDIQTSFDRMGLHQHLSPNRRNGFFAMVERIKSLAADS